jgi:hypothetical protein
VNREADIAAIGTRIKETSVAGIRSALRFASGLGPNELAALQRDAVNQFHAEHTPEAFCTRFRKAIESLFPA